jgi:hypothetical protein
MTGLLILAFVKRVATSVKTWLSHRSFWQLSSLALCAALVVQHIALRSEQRHASKVEAQLSKATAELKRIDGEARAAKERGDKLAKELRDRTDEENRRIAGDADALRVSGPGKAVCRPAPTAASGHEEGRGNGDAPGPQVPSDDRAAVPWPWLVARAEQADLNRAEVVAWRDWYSRLVAAWPKSAEPGK